MYLVHLSAQPAIVMHTVKTGCRKDQKPSLFQKYHGPLRKTIPPDREKKMTQRPFTNNPAREDSINS